MFVDSTNWQDGEKYFSGCYIKIKEYGDTLCYIDKVTPEGLFGKDENGDKVFIEIDGKTTGKVGYDIDYVIPHKSWFQLENYAFFLHRIPARMWKKGINKQNTRIVKLGEAKVDEGVVPIDFNFLRGYVRKPFFQHFSSYKEYNSIALSKRFAMTQKGEIFLDLTPIGKYMPSQNACLVQKLFTQEVGALFKGVKIVNANC